ncbi:hypothetical protein JCM10212_006418 [Sporobolomyces blumeae]
MARAPPYLRAQSSPTLPPHHSLTPSPTSSTFIGAPLRPRPQQPSAAAQLYRDLSVPVFVVDGQLCLREMNRAAKKVLAGRPSANGLHDDEANELEMIKSELVSTATNGRASEGAEATSVFAVDPDDTDSSPRDQVRHTLERLVDLCSAREKRGTWGEGEKATFVKDGRRWDAEVVVRRVYGFGSDNLGRDGDEHDDLPDWVEVPSRDPASSTSTNRRETSYEVVLLRPWKDHMAELPPVSGPLKTRDVLDSVRPVRSEISAASLPNPHVAAPDVDPSVLPNLVPSHSSGSGSHFPESPMRRKDSYYSDRTPTIGSAHASGNLFSSSWGIAVSARSGSSMGNGGSSGGSWEYAKPFGATTEEEETESPEPASPPARPDLQNRRHDLSLRGYDHYDPDHPVPPLSNHLRLPSAALQAANDASNANSNSTQPRSDGTDPSSSGGGRSVMSFDNSSKSNSTAPTTVHSGGTDSGSNSLYGGSPPGASKAPRISPTTAAALRPGASSPVVPEALKGMGISVSSAGIQLTQSTPLHSPSGKGVSDATPVTTASEADSLASQVAPPPLTSPSLVTPTSSSSPLPFSTQLRAPLPRVARPHPLSLSRTTLSDSSTASTTSQSPPAASTYPLASPRPTALPPLPDKAPPAKPEAAALLQFAALANLPKTGVILADSDISSGYVNALARELLMGVPAVDGDMPNSPMSEDLPDDWWNFGYWSTEEEPWSSVSGASGASNSSGPFFASTSAYSPSISERTNPFDAKDLMFQAIIEAGEATEAPKGQGTAGSGLRIGKPSESNRFRTTVAGILARSLVGNEKRKTALRGHHRESNSNLPAQATARDGVNSPSERSSGSGSGSQRSGSSGAVPGFIAAGGVGAQGKKPYKVFDQSFSQRVIDPFEPLLELCARRGEQPPNLDPDNDDEYDRATNGMIVGVEVEVWEAAAVSKSAAERSDIRQDSFMTANVPAMQLRKKRVRRRIIEITAAPLFVPSKVRGREHVGGVLLLKDVTDDQRRLGSMQVDSSKKKKGSGETYFKQILDNMPQMVWTTTPRGSHSYFNKLWYEYTGLEPEQSLGLGWQSPFHEDDMPAALKAWSRSLESGEPYSVEYRCRRYDGSWRWMLGRALPFRDADGKIQGWFGTCTDFDELYKMREQLRRTLQQNAAVVQGASCLLLAIDREGIITYMQGAQKAAVIAGAGLEGEVEGKHISALQPTPEFMEIYRKIIDGETLDQTLTWSHSKDGTCFRCLLTPLTETRPDAEALVTGCIVVAHDITDLVTTQSRLKQSYEERARLQASETAATEASRLKSEFLALTSHELRTPIAHMLGLSELLLSEPLSESQKSLASQILRSGDVLLEMIGQVLDMGKVEAGKLDLESRPFNLNDLSSDARLFSTAASKKGLKFVEDIDEFSTEVLGDMPRLRQVLTNLLSNAVKFTKEGSITLRAKKISEDDKTIRVRWDVQDTGVGIKREAISSLFKPFHQADVSTSRQFGGTGLGLSISKNLIELMGGKITLTSEYGVGTKMSVDLKLEKVSMDSLSQATSSVPKAVQEASDVIKENTWVLVVDDNDLNRSIIARLLTKMGFHVESAANGYEALDMVEKKKYDLVLMDHQMDGIDGLETTVKMRQSANPLVSKLKIIALTASALKGDQEKFLESGADGYLSKPVRSAVLEATILKALAPKSQTRQSSSANTPSVESASRSGFDFGSKPFDPSAPPEHDDDVASVRRRPSYPSYSSEAGL